MKRLSGPLPGTYCLADSLNKKREKQIRMLLPFSFSFYWPDVVVSLCFFVISALNIRDFPFYADFKTDTEFERLIDDLPDKRAKKWRASLIVLICTRKTS